MTAARMVARSAGPLPVLLAAASSLKVRSHPHSETADEPGAEAKGGLAMYQGQRP
jgi:hypothetical protein